MATAGKKTWKKLKTVFFSRVSERTLGIFPHIFVFLFGVLYPVRPSARSPVRPSARPPVRPSAAARPLKQLCHIHSSTHKFVTHTTLSHTIYHTQSFQSYTRTHTQLCHTHTKFCHTQSFAWQAWRWVTSTFVLRGRRGALQHRAGSGGALGRR